MVPEMTALASIAARKYVTAETVMGKKGCVSRTKICLRSAASNTWGLQIGGLQVSGDNPASITYRDAATPVE
jgi:hypothetical protein